MRNGGTVTQITIDIDVHRAIEAKRSDFDQTHNDILREVFNLIPATHGDQGVSAEGTPAPKQHEGKPDQGTTPGRGPRHAAFAANRQTGLFSVELLGKRAETHSLRDAYVLSLKLLSDRDPSFLDVLSRRETRARRIVARRKEDLYKNNPRLAEDFAMRLSDDWWVDTNLSRPQCESRLEVACEIAGIQFGRDLTLRQASDLGARG